MCKFKVVLPFMKQTFIHRNNTLYIATIDSKGKNKLSAVKGGTIKECLDYIKTVYKINNNNIEEIR